MVVYLKTWVYEYFDDGIINGSSIIALLILYFLQCGIAPRVLPNLQIEIRDLFERAIPVKDLKFNLNLKDWWAEEKLKPCNKSKVKYTVISKLAKIKTVGFIFLDFVGNENTSVGELMLKFF